MIYAVADVGFWRGFWTAILVLELLAFTVTVVRFVPGFTAMIAEFDAAPPRLFTIVTSRGWAIGVAVGLVALVVAANRVPRTETARVVGLAAMAFVGAVALGVTLWGLYEPIFALAGRIR